MTVDEFTTRYAHYRTLASLGDRHAMAVMNQYGSLRWAGHRPLDALAIAETECDPAWQAEMQRHLDAAAGI